LSAVNAQAAIAAIKSFAFDDKKASLFIVCGQMSADICNRIC